MKSAIRDAFMGQPSKQRIIEVPLDVDVWTTDEVAAYLKVSENFVRDLAKKKRLPGAFQIGTLWRFNAEKVKEFARGAAAA